MMPSNQDVADFLRRIPQSNQPAIKLSKLTTHGQDIHNLGALYGVCQMLALFGIVRLEQHGNLAEIEVQASSQTAKYALMSLAEYLQNDMSIVADWETRGIQNHIFANGASFLRALEKQRQQATGDPTPSRYVKVAQVLIKRINPETNEHELLMQFDENANQYQLIGGRWSEKDGTNIENTITREIEEELPLNNMQYSKNYQLDLLIDNLIVDGLISSTFGAITRYEFCLFHMTQLELDLDLQSDDQWITIKMLLAGQIRVNEREYVLRTPNVFERINELLPDGLIGIEVSRK